MQHVFDLCIRDGLTIDACAAQLRVGRDP